MVLGAKISGEAFRGFGRFGQHLFLADRRAVDPEVQLGFEEELKQVASGLERELCLVLHPGLAGVTTTNVWGDVFQLLEFSNGSPRYTELKMIRSGGLGAVVRENDDQNGKKLPLRSSKVYLKTYYM